MLRCSLPQEIQRTLADFFALTQFFLFTAEKGEVFGQQTAGGRDPIITHRGVGYALARE